MSRKHYHQTQQQPNRQNWEILLTLVIIMGSTLGTTIPLYMQANSQIQAIREDISAIHQEMKDFHGRLCAIEEKNKEK